MICLRLRPSFAPTRGLALLGVALWASPFACKSKDAASEVASAAAQADKATEQVADAAQAVGRAASSAVGGNAAAPQAPTDVAAIPAGAKTTASGLGYKVLKAGSGQRHPGPTDRVQVHYSGWTTDGKLFDSSVARGTPATFGLNQVIGGWTEGLQLMVEGEQARFWVPAKLAYNNEAGRPMGMLVFDVELLKIL